MFDCSEHESCASLLKGLEMEGEGVGGVIAYIVNFFVC